MDRKWLWKKKSSEKSSGGETESSGSVSSHSGRCSDEQEALKDSPNHDSQSPEVTSKAVSSGHDVNDSLKSLTERLSAALVNVSAKEDLVKQHSKVAEEAVAGWEKAENEVASLKLQLEAAVKQKSALEDRVSHLDGALKECVRQLRQSREEQEKNIHEAVVEKTRDWEATKVKLENQITDLQTKAETNRSGVSAFVAPHLSHKLEALERENKTLKLELLSQAEELEISTIERDLSTQAAETASKQHLESIKKVAKLEAECRRLKAVACKIPFVNDHKSSAASSMYVDSCMDSQSDSGERLSMMDIDSQKMNGSDPNKRDLGVSDSWALALVAELDQFKNEKAVNKNLPASSVDIDLMDDFLEMERLAALPQPESETGCLESEAIVNASNNDEIALRDELEAMSHRTAELEYKLEKLEEERAELQVMSHRTAELEYKLEKLEVEKAELEATSHQTADLEDKLEKLELEKAELVTMSYRAAELEEKLEKLEGEKEKLEVEKAQLECMSYRAAELEEKLEKLEGEKEKLEVEKAQLECMNYRAAELEEKLEKLEGEKEKLEVEKDELETALAKSKECYVASEFQLKEAEMMLEELQKELKIAKESKLSIESQLISIEAETRTMSAKVNSLEAEVQRERASSAKISVRCQNLEEELSRKNEEVEFQKTACSNSESKIKQEDIAVAAGKLAECQKTIASLGNQLKSLATLEDFLIDTANIPEFSAAASQIPRSDEHWKMHSNGTFSPKRDSVSKQAVESSGLAINRNEDNSPPSSSSSSSSTVVSTHVSSEKNRNGFAKFFSRTKSGIRLEI
ncbi:putative filament-like plant protein [Rosa chinensis]|uniref:Putative filament-like plant protein n=1 Tax=Rosa chinensis TaxID=74649 RepID=A0A2P6PX99_ROSCH|nr:filament-like plant protein 1 isoform X2 [Rosa chinensis]PRQ26553.1 putative filament-like plant protein [Rosa chinensis]